MIQKNLKYFGFGALALFQIFSFSTAFAQDVSGTNWDIQDFNSTIQLNKDSTILVTEHIVADFTQEAHHGIVRIIPVQYTDTSGNNSEIPLNIISVKDDQGSNWNYTTSDDGSNLSIQIGDPNTLINKTVSYNITYQAQRALANYSDHDELYWNSTGNQWDVPILKAEATVKLPQSADKSTLKATCYTGTQGSTAQDCKADVVDGSTFHFSMTAGSGTVDDPALQPSEGLTIVAGYPKGIIQPSPPSPEQIFAAAPWYMKIYLFLSQNWGLLIPIIVAVIMFYLWFTNGRDPSTGKTAIMPLYEAPDNLTPTEVGTIVDESVDIQDITSAIIDMAVRGYLKIVESKDKSFLGTTTTYKFELLKPNYESDAKLLDFEKKILNAVFGSETSVNLSDLNYKFYKYIPDIKKTIYARLVTNGYFPADPEKIRATYMGIGFGLMFIPLFLLGGLLQVFSWSLIAGVIVSGIVIMVGGYFMPKRTLKGVETRYKILGLEEFIKTAETDRLKFQEKENIFEKLLPYAMTLGIAEKWTKTFEGIYKSPPSWYQSNDPYFMNNFSTYYLLNSMNSFSNSMGTTFQSSPRSSGSGFGGGGFSGGGGGGGGGHGW